MQGQENNIVKQQLIRQLKQLSQKQKMIQYYMSYDFPQRQRSLKRWWEDLIQNVIRKKNQIYVTFKDLQSITNINGMKPVPLKNILKELKKQFIFVKQDDITLDKKPQKKVKPWYTSIISFAWAKDNQDEMNFPFTFDPNQKIISSKFKQRKKRELISYLQKQFEHQNSRFQRNFIKKASWQLKVDQVSIELILQQLKRQKQVVIINDQNFGDQVLIYSHDRKKMKDENFIKIEKIKCSLRGTLQRFDIFYEKSSDKISNLKLKAKQAVINADKNKARVLVAQMRKQQEYRDKINVQKQVLEQRISQIEVNQMNKSSIDLLQQAQKTYQQVAVDERKFEQVMDKAREIQMESDQVNKKFQQLAASDEVQDQVEGLMREMQDELSKKKVIEPRNINLQIENKPQKTEPQKVQQHQATI